VVSHDLLVRMALRQEGSGSLEAVCARPHGRGRSPPHARIRGVRSSTMWTCVRDFARALRHAAVFPPRCAPAVVVRAAGNRVELGSG